MRKFQKILLFIVLIFGSLMIAGCTSIINQNDIEFMSSLQEFQNESVTRIGNINADIKLKQWDSVRADLVAYQGVISAEIDHLNSLLVSEKVIPIREKAVAALEKQEKILQSAQNLSELNATVIPDLAGDYLSDVIEMAIKSALSGKE